MNEEEQYKDYRISALTPEELEDALAEVRAKILNRVSTLSKNYKALMALQEKREKIEIRLEELGYREED